MIALPDQKVWDLVGRELDERGFSVIPGLIGRDACEELAAK